MWLSAASLGLLCHITNAALTGKESGTVSSPSRANAKVRKKKDGRDQLRLDAVTSWQHGVEQVTRFAQNVSQIGSKRCRISNAHTTNASTHRRQSPSHVPTRFPVMYAPLIAIALLVNLLFAQEAVDKSHLLTLCRGRYDHPLCVDVLPMEDDITEWSGVPMEAPNTLNGDLLLQLERLHTLPVKRKASFIRFGKRLNEQKEKRKASFIRFG